MSKIEIILVACVIFGAHIVYNQVHDCKMSGGKFVFNSVWFVCTR